LVPRNKRRETGKTDFAIAHSPQEIVRESGGN